LPYLPFYLPSLLALALLFNPGFWLEVGWILFDVFGSLDSAYFLARTWSGMTLELLVGGKGSLSYFLLDFYFFCFFYFFYVYKTSFYIYFLESVDC
jgi:hypothetical protein